MSHNIVNKIVKKRVELHKLPYKILKEYEHPHLIDCLLYELSKINTLYLSFIAYNPDFNLCKGVAGISNNELDSIIEDPWSQSNDIITSLFNNTIKSISFSTKKGSSAEEVSKHIKENLLSNSIKNEHIFSLKHGNIGILGYTEIESEDNNKSTEYIKDGANLLGLCYL